MGNHKIKAFTLVELLVVVGVIAVLIAFLLPVLEKARDQARLVGCLSNIRQVGFIAIGMYANDYKGQVTPLIGVKQGFPATLYVLFSPQTWAIRTDMYPAGNPYNATWADLIQPYLNSNNQRDQATFTQYSPVFYCTADWAGMDGIDSRVGWWANGWPGFREFSWRMNYSITPIKSNDLDFNGSGFAVGTPTFGRKISSVKNASNKVLLAESHYEAVAGDRWGVISAEGFNDGWGAGVLTAENKLRNTRVSPARHKTGFAVSFFDGSARIVPFHDRTQLCGNYVGSNYPNYPATSNWGLAGWGPNWDLDVP
jgi:prepilin-type N-terminal cleavage/methylation domain-containing protein